MLNKFKFKSSILFVTHILLENSLRVLQLPTHLSNLTANDCVHQDANYMITSINYVTYIFNINHNFNNNNHIFNPNIALNYIFFIKYLCISKI